jgi:septal ring factor EnvC (AmiA/AmiB activator)
MVKIVFIAVFILSNLAFASTKAIESKINSNKKILEQNKRLNQQTKAKIDNLSKEIKTQTAELNKINSKIKILNQVILTQKDKLQLTQKQLEELEAKALSIQKAKEQSEYDIVNIIIENFSWAFALNLASKKSLQEIIDSEMYAVLSSNTKEEINRLNRQYLIISQNKIQNEEEIVKLKKFIQVETKRKESLATLQKKQEKTIGSLHKKHLAYQDELKSVVKKQKSLSTLLSKLNILKEDELKKEQERQAKLALEKKQREQKLKQPKATTQEKLANNIDIEVRMLGSSTSGIKIGKYKGVKTIAPLKSYEITKKFGKYFDPVYKIELFNESIVLKSNEEKAKVFNVLNGKVVYAKKDSGMLENVVIIQHDNGLHTIYSHLEQISPTIKVGKWVQKGYVVGRVNELLTFQATKNSTHINPQDLFN